MSVKVETGKPTAYKAGVLTLVIADLADLKNILPKAAVTDLTIKLKIRKFKAEWGSACLLGAVKGLPAEQVAVVSLGKNEDLNTKKEGLRRGLGSLSSEVKRSYVTEMGLVLPEEKQAELAAAAVEALSFANYLFANYSERLKNQKAQLLKKLVVLSNRENKAVVTKKIQAAKHVADGAELTRDLVNQPAGHMSPQELVYASREIADASDLIKLKTLNGRQAEAAGFSAFLAVAKGSDAEPYVIHLTYTPENKTSETKKIALVGKGITFDSGGLSLKPAEYMEDMKVDMAGAATVLGIFSSLAKLKPGVEVHGIIAACENMPSGTAYRPGDVIETKGGKTIEILNTDAEGRVTLADALAYAQEQEPDKIVDFATLTGAAVVALGETHAGLWSNNNNLAKELTAAAKKSGEGLVHLPMPAEYRQQIVSDIADVRNTATSRYGGAITAAMFLREFVDETPWAHLDIAGPAYFSRLILPYWNKGASGYGVRTIVDWLLS